MEPFCHSCSLIPLCNHLTKTDRDAEGCRDDLGRTRTDLALTASVKR